MNSKIMLAAMVAVMGLALCGIIVNETEDSDAAMGSSTNPVSSVSSTIQSFVTNYSDRTIYVYVGSSFSLSANSQYTAYSGNSSHGISASSSGFSGTITNATGASSSFTITYAYDDGNGAIYGSIRIYAIEKPSYRFYFSANNSSYGSIIAYYYDSGSKTYIGSGQQQPVGRTLYVEASPASGYRFTNWTAGGSIVSSNALYSFTMPSNNYTLTATFVSSAPSTYNLVFRANDSNYGSVMGYYYDTDDQPVYFGSNTNHRSGEDLYVQATARTGYQFVNWTSNGTVVSTNPTYNFTMPSSAYSLVANFTAIASYPLTFTANDSNYGSVMGYYYDTDDQPVYFGSNTNHRSGEDLYVQATARTGYQFVNWTSNGTVVSTSPTYNFTMPSTSYDLVANFEANAGYALTFSANDSDYGSVLGYYYDTDAARVYFGSGLTHDAGEDLYVQANAKNGYQFVNWTSGDTVVSTEPIYNFTMPSTSYDLVANFEAAATYPLTFTANDSDYGSVIAYYVDTDGGKTYFGSGAELPSGTTVFLQAIASTGNVFVSWTAAGVTVSSSGIYSFTMPSSAYSLVANFREKIEGATYWTNDLYNGTISIAFKFNPSSSKTHMMDIPLYTGSTDSQGNTTWMDSGYTLKVTAAYPATITTAIYQGGNQIDSRTGSYGNWSAFVLDLQLSTGVISFVPIDLFAFSDFTDYSTIETSRQIIFSWEVPDNATALTIEHTDTGTGNAPRFSVVGTATFLNTFGIVLNNPNLNVNSYFPQYNAVRVNLYSFAVYGESMTVNGKTWAVDGSDITMTYIDDEGHYIYAEPGTEGSVTRTLTLSNISITWDGANCLLSFNDSNFTIDLGSYSTGSKTFSFTGLWYFTATIAEPYTATQTEVTGEWDSVLNMDATTVILLFLGIILGAGLFCHVKFKLKWLDAALILGALIVAFTLLG